MPKTAAEEAKVASPETNLEVEFLKRELEDLRGSGSSSPFEKVNNQDDIVDDDDDDDDDDDGLSLDFMAQVQKERTSLRASQL